MRTFRRLVALLLVMPLLAGGCGRRHPFSQSELDRARAALETSLQTWKKGERLDRLQRLPEPIRFVEEWPYQGLRLLNYEIVDDVNTDAEVIRFTVKLTVQDADERRQERQVTYAVALKSPIIIGRDPYF